MLRDAVLAEIGDQLGRLTTEQLMAILDYVEALPARKVPSEGKDAGQSCESVVVKDWGHLEELEAWRNL